MSLKKYHWPGIQRYHDKEHSLRDCIKHFGVCWSSIQKAKKRGDFVSRSKEDAEKLKVKLGRNGAATTKEYWTKEKRKEHSERKKEFYKKYPEKHPNRKLANNKIKMSYPEKLAYCFLEDNKIVFNHQERILDYYCDFFIKDKNLIIEIDGKYWHDKEKDKIRDEKIREEGFSIIHIPASNVVQNLGIIFHEQYIFSEEEIMKRIIIPKNKPVKRCTDCNTKIGYRSIRCKKCCLIYLNKFGCKVIRKFNPSKVEFVDTIKRMKGNLCAVGRHYGVSDNAIRKRCKRYYIDWKNLTGCRP